MITYGCITPLDKDDVDGIKATVSTPFGIQKHHASKQEEELEMPKSKAAKDHFDVEAMTCQVQQNTTVYLTIKGTPVAQPRHRVHGVQSSGICCYPASAMKTTLRNLVNTGPSWISQGTGLPHFGSTLDFGLQI